MIGGFLEYLAAAPYDAGIHSDIIHPGWYVGLMFLLALIPFLLGTLTSYLKMSIALGVLRNGFGAQQVPNNTVVVALSLVLSLYVMQPVLGEITVRAAELPPVALSKFPARADIAPYLSVLLPWREFLLRHAGQREIGVLTRLERANSKSEPAADDGKALLEDISLATLIPAFMLTELREGMMIGFVLLLPFIIIDLVVANLLAGLGMYMMSPTILSLPLKLLLFVSVDGWLLISRGLIASYSTGV